MQKYYAKKLRANKLRSANLRVENLRSKFLRAEKFSSRELRSVNITLNFLRFQICGVKNERVKFWWRKVYAYAHQIERKMCIPTRSRY